MTEPADITSHTWQTKMADKAIKMATIDLKNFLSNKP